MIAQCFEIKVALLGYVSVGKTTVLNALFQDKFSEVSMRRTTAAINFFRISTRKPNNKTKGDSCKEERWSPDTGEPQQASSTLKETIADNKVLRTTNEVKEKTFDIQLDEPLCGTMRPDTSLVIVDIPGLNEAGSSDMYKDYVQQQWDTYDCVIVVMDAEKGVNTEEQVSLLEFVKMQQQMCSDVPVIVLCNKVDDPSNEEIAAMVEEVREKVKEVFKVDCSNAAIDKILEQSPSNNDTATSTTPSTNDDKSTLQDTTFAFGSNSFSAAGTSDTNGFTFTSPVEGSLKPEAKNIPLSFGTATNFSGFSTEASSFSFGNDSKTAFGSGIFGTSPSTKHTEKFPANSASKPAFGSGKRYRASKQFTYAAKVQAPTTVPESISKTESPVLFLPVSAENAFVYRTVSRLPLEDFKLLDRDIIERLGREEAGRMRWKAMSVEEKYNIVHAAVSDPSAYKERLKSTNFDRFLKILEHVVGGVGTQTRILERQLDIATKKVEQGEQGLAAQLRSIYERSKVLGKATDHLAAKFWSVYKLVETSAFESLQHDFSLLPLYRCMDELIQYAKSESQVLFADGTDDTLKAEYQKILEVAKNLVKRQCLAIVQQHADWKVEESSFMSTGVPDTSSRHSQLLLRTPVGGRQVYSLQPGATPPAPKHHPFYWSPVNKTLPLNSASHTWTNNLTGQVVKCEKNPDLPKATWSNLSYDDWMAISNSILLMVHDRNFAESFGAEMNELDLLKAQVAMFLGAGRGTDTRTNYLAGKYIDGAFVPNDPTKYSLVKQIDIPENLSNEKHWGHLAWMFCQFQKSLEESIE